MQVRAAPTADRAVRATAVSVRDLQKYYRVAGGAIHALKDLTFDIKEGEFVSVVGPSGCGKSTILKIIAGIVPRSEGVIEIDGTAISGPSDRIGVAFQSPVLLPWRTVIENILLPLDVARQPRTDSGREAALKLIKLVGLGGFEERYPNELSGGMQQRVAICRSLIRDPSILLMDEPFGALDALTRENMNVELQRIWMERNKTVLLITHSIPEAVFLSDRVLVMTGRPGTVDEIIDIDLPRPRRIEMIGTEEFGHFGTRIRQKFAAHSAL